mmetsp:Transcript_1874/g.1966  ORF Transcript_1874/g.1966 Transcript_1874/m.1966 type:complete len:303 (+) Transcript_1874:36-944(+)|eukprot:CAMPEP_0176434806 /NCGR_PEP_ID=MMETSP0127-20121128/16904_1 /TAXON_ID=938130 /ORGANISM="Platyophrya macrostoma, Strain WH" /LENGTH=302 /DNA_ID=CAMNT_0017817629 /DNA_START=34 /DNA_END=942 /DNA_ORIENTATION=-
MQNLEAYQNIELQKQLAKMQMINTFQNYLQKALSLSTAQQLILQQTGLGATNRSALLQPAYFDPTTIFGPSLSLLNNTVPQIEPRTLQQPTNLTLLPQTNLQQAINPHFNFQSKPIQLPQNIVQQQPQPSVQSTQMLELPPLPLKKKADPTDEFDDLNDFFQKKVSNASTKSSWSSPDEEFETGKKMTFEKEIYIKNPGLPTQKARKRTKVICGHPWKNHHAKGLCKNCYETYGKTRRPWKCEHQAHFAKGYCKKCYLKLRQKISVNEVLPLAVEELKNRVDKKLDSINMEVTNYNVKEEAV